MQTDSQTAIAKGVGSSDGLAAVQELKDKIIAWSDEARDAVDGKYGHRPDGRSKEHWEGRKAALFELRAFLPNLGEHYIHVSKVEDMIRERLRAN